MDSLYLLLPVSVLLVLAVIGVFAWALHAGQFDDLDREGWRVLEGGSDAEKFPAADAGDPAVDPDQGKTRTRFGQ